MKFMKMVSWALSLTLAASPTSAVVTAMAFVIAATPAEAVTRIFTFEGTTRGNDRLSNAPLGIGYSSRFVIDGSVIGEVAVDGDEIDYLYRDALVSYVVSLDNGEMVQLNEPADILLTAFVDTNGLVEELEYDAVDTSATATAGLQQFTQIDDDTPPKEVTFTFSGLSFGTSGEDGFQGLDTLALLPFDGVGSAIRYDADMTFVEAFSNGGFRTQNSGGVSVSQRINFTENVVVPLPAGAPLLAAGLLALGVLRRLRVGSAVYHQDPSLSDGAGRAQDAVGFRPPTPRTLVPVGLAALGSSRGHAPTVPPMSTSVANNYFGRSIIIAQVRELPIERRDETCRAHRAASVVNP